MSAATLSVLYKVSKYVYRNVIYVLSLYYYDFLSNVNPN